VERVRGLVAAVAEATETDLARASLTGRKPRPSAPVAARPVGQTEFPLHGRDGRIRERDGYGCSA
jgi:hypothetical protein